MAAQTAWTSSNARVLEISATGLAKGLAGGDVSISARYQSRFASGHTLVLAVGTYRLTGRVMETGFGLQNATVTVVSGVGEGLSAVTGSDGAYVLYGVGGSIGLRASKEGYADRLETIDVSADRTFDFEVVADRPRANLAGTYSLTIVVGPCQLTRGSLPPEVLKRTYRATVSQDGSRVTVTLSDATFLVTRGRGDHFSGFLEPDGSVTFSIGDVYSTTSTAGQSARPGGTSATPRSTLRRDSSDEDHRPGISGTLAGDVEVANGTVPPFAFNTIASRCADAHRFELVRR